MCKSQAEGGQRCPKQARANLKAAQDALTAANQAALDAAITAGRDSGGAFTVPTHLQQAQAAAAAAVTAAEIELASTPTGRREFATKVAEYATNPIRNTLGGRIVVGSWCTTIAKGDALRAENRAIADQARFTRHPRWAEAEQQIARSRAEGRAGWAAVNRTLSRMGIHNVTQDPYLANLVAEKFGSGKHAYGKAKPPTGGTAEAVPTRPTPAPMSTDEFDRTYRPERHANGARSTLLRDTPNVTTPDEARHWWTVEETRDGDITYTPGTDATATNTRIGWCRTAAPWTTGKEAVSVADDRHYDYEPATLT